MAALHGVEQMGGGRKVKRGGLLAGRAECLLAGSVHFIRDGLIQCSPLHKTTADAHGPCKASEPMRGKDLGVARGVFPLSNRPQRRTEVGGTPRVAWRLWPGRCQRSACLKGACDLKCPLTSVAWPLVFLAKATARKSSSRPRGFRGLWGQQ